MEIKEISIKIEKKTIPEETIFLFTDLKPADRILKVIETYIFPDLEKIGFKMSKSKLSIRREINGFDQYIQFSKNHWNHGNEVVAFSPHFCVRAKQYAKWYKAKYNKELINDYIISEEAGKIPNWTHEYYDNQGYDLAKNDNNDIIKALKTNIEINGLAFLNKLSDWQGAIDFIKSRDYLYKAPILYDFTRILNDKKQAENILQWFQTSAKELRFSQDTLDEIMARQTDLDNWK